jgi:DNA-directed RNA polymerase specialized sigma24 family protein
MSVGTDSLPAGGAAPCPCRRGDAAAEAARQRPLLERAARGDREAFERLYLMQVDGVYRYLLAWTGERAAARDLTEQVFRAALAWLPVVAGEAGAAPAGSAGAGAPQAGGAGAGARQAGAGAPHADADFGAWLVALARDAVTQRRKAGWMAGPERAGDGRPPPADALEAAARLGDPEREVVVLRLLLGHSLAHTAELSGYSVRAVTELQLAACLAIRELTVEPYGGGPAPADGPAAPAALAAPRGQRAADFQRRLEHWDVDLTGDDPELADALAIASSLRRAAPSQIVAPDRRFVLRLLEALASQHAEASGGALPARLRRALAALRVEIVRRPRPFAATAVAAAAILAILTLQAFGSPRPPACGGGRPCPTSTTAPVAAPASATAVPLTSVRGTTTTTSLPGPPSTTAAAPVPTAPPPTSPPSTAPRTTRPPRTTTSRQPTTTATTTSTTTTTTVAPTPST